MQHKRKPNIRTSNAGVSEPAIIGGLAMILVGFVLLWIDSSNFTSWGWATSGAVGNYGGIYLVLILFILGPVVAIWA